MPLDVAAGYLYVNIHNAAAVPRCALPWGCEETSKEICFAGVVIPNRNLKKGKKLVGSTKMFLKDRTRVRHAERFAVACSSACARV